MVTVAEKQRDIQQRFGISNQKFAELFQEQTGRRLGPELMGQDYDALREAKIGSAQSLQSRQSVRFLKWPGRLAEPSSRLVVPD